MYPTRKRSGGPRTAEGKAHCSRNALKTGAFSPVTVLPWEKQEDVEALREQFYADFPPADALEASLLDQLITVTWKRLRLRSLESSVLITMMQRPADSLEGHDFAWDRSDEENLFQVATELTESDLKTLQAIVHSCDQLTEEAIVSVPALEVEHPELFSDLLEHLGLDDSEELASALEGDPEEWSISLAGARSRAQSLLAAHAGLGERAMRLERYKEKRLLAFLEKGVFDRAGSEVDRAYSRAMTEWRKHREWRVKHALVEIESANDSGGRQGDVIDTGTDS